MCRKKIKKIEKKVKVDLIDNDFGDTGKKPNLLCLGRFCYTLLIHLKPF